MGNKTLAALGIWLFGFSAVYSKEIPIQLMLVDNSGFEKVNESVKLRLTMSNDTSSTLGQYQEVHLTQSNEYGIISENLGSGVATTNSQVLSLEQFPFLTNEPLIKIELDTSSASNQYYTVGYVPYSYPMVARRALSADSSNYSDQSMNSEYADTAEYAKNFNESYDGDTSASNEIQELVYDSGANTLSISNGNKVQLGRYSYSSSQINSTILTQVEDSINLNQIMAADEEYFYFVVSNTITKKLRSNIDSTVSKINVGFNISYISPQDSVVFGSNPANGSYTEIHSCDLNGNQYQTKKLYNFGINGIVSSRDSNIAIRSGNNHYLWNKKNGSWSSFSKSAVSVTKNKIYSTRFIYGNCYCKKIDVTDRFTGITKNTNMYWSDNYVFRGEDSLESRYILTYNSNISSGGVSVYDSTSQLLAISDDGSLTVDVGMNGYFLVEFFEDSYNNSYVRNEKLYLLNTNNEKHSIGKVALKNWSLTSPFSSGNHSVISTPSEFLILFQNVKNYFIEGRYVSGNFIYSIPYQ